MKLNLKTAIKDIYGKEIIQDGEPLLVQKIVIDAVLMPLETDKNEDQKKKLERYELAKKCVNNDEAEFTVEELTEIKKRINSGYANPLILGQINELIEGK